MPNQDYYGGLDLGQKRDYSVVAVILKKNGHFFLQHMHRFPLRTEYLQVLAYLKRVEERFWTVRGWYIDQTGVGEGLVEVARKSGLRNVQGIELSLPRKQNVMTNLKQVMEGKRLHIPKLRDLVSEIGGEIAELTATGKTKFYHRSGTHDDRLWALALAVYGARHEVETYHPAIIFGNAVNPWRLHIPPKNLSRLSRAGPTPAWDNQTAGPPKRICPICGSQYTYEPGKDSRCEHVKKDGTLTLPEPKPYNSEYYHSSGPPCPWPPPRSQL